MFMTREARGRSHSRDRSRWDLAHRLAACFAAPVPEVPQHAFNRQTGPSSS